MASLGCRSKWDAQRALMLDATLIVLQFAFFLVLGLCLFGFYGGQPLDVLGLRSSDEIFPKFIVENLPSGLAGLVIAGVLASAMGTLSSSISSLASAAFLDLFRPLRRGKELGPREEVAWSRVFTLVWGLTLIGGALLFTDTKNAVARERDAFVGFAAGLAAMVGVLYGTRIDFTWHTLIGCVATLAAGNLSAGLRGRESTAPSAAPPAAW